VGIWCGQRHAEERGGKARAQSCHEDGGRCGGSGASKGAGPAEVGTDQHRASRGGEGGVRGPCVKAWAGRGKEGAGPGPRE
jgi:hypothetical protein